MQIVPAVLTDNLSDASRALGAFQALANLVHIDVLDNTLVPGNTLMPNEFPPFARGAIAWHLMVRNPLPYLEQCVGFPTKAVIIHAELGGNLADVAEAIHAQGFLAGVAVNPATPIELVMPWLPSFDWVQIMTVEPGKQGSEFQPQVLAKITALEHHNPKVVLSVDGGINQHTIHQVVPFRPAMITVGSFLQPGPTLAQHWRDLSNAIGAAHGGV